MAGFKAPGFDERTEAARAAKQRMLDRYKNRPVMDEATIAAKKAASEAREQAEAEKRAARKAAQEEAKAARAEKAAAAKAPPKPVLTPEQAKAMRDARYAARKQRKG